MHGVGELNGGLAQALSVSTGDTGGLDRGLALVQLKRAWRGAAFAKGSLVPLCAAGRLSQRDLGEFQGVLRQLEDGIVEEIARIREQLASE